MKFKVDLVLKLNRKQTAKIRKEKQKCERKKLTCPTWPDLPGGPVGWPSPPGLCQSSPTSASRQRRESARRARGRHATRLPACVAWPPRRLPSSPQRCLGPLDTTLPSSALPLVLSRY